MKNVVLFAVLLTTFTGYAAFAQSSPIATKSPAKNYKAEPGQATVITKKPMATVQKPVFQESPSQKQEVQKEKLAKTAALKSKHERKSNKKSNKMAKEAGKMAKKEQPKKE